ncbi:unnamed protein product, partial [Amoebophrya sp. A25]|eukprot:GSA25T00009573001.1
MATISSRWSHLGRWSWVQLFSKLLSKVARLLSKMFLFVVFCSILFFTWLLLNQPEMTQIWQTWYDISRKQIESDTRTRARTEGEDEELSSFSLSRFAKCQIPRAFPPLISVSHFRKTHRDFVKRYHSGKVWKKANGTVAGKRSYQGVGDWRNPLTKGAKTDEWQRLFNGPFTMCEWSDAAYSQRLIVENMIRQHEQEEKTEMKTTKKMSLGTRVMLEKSTRSSDISENQQMNHARSSSR